MSENTVEFTLEAHVGQVVAESNMSHKLIAEIIRTSTVPLDSVERIINQNPWVDHKILETILSNSDKPFTGIFAAEELEAKYVELGLSTEDIDARYEYHVKPTDSTVYPESPTVDNFYIVEELGFLDFGNFVVGRTSQPLLIVSKDSVDGEFVVTGKSAVNALIVCPKASLNVDQDGNYAEHPEDIWEPAGVKVYPSIAGGSAFEFQGDFAVLNAYACDILGIPYCDGDLAVIPAKAENWDALIVEDVNSGASVPLFMPLS